MSVFSTLFWIKKGYTEEEAKHQVSIRRPNNIHYYINKGYSEEDAKNLVHQRQAKGGEKRKAMTDKEKRTLSPRCLEFWIAKGLTPNEAQKELSDFQKHFSKKICIEKYGELEGEKIWKERQDKWQATLNSKTPDEIKEINIKKNRWKNLNDEETTLLKEKVSNSIKVTVNQRPKEVTKEIFDRIVGTKISRGQYLPREEHTAFEQYKRKVWAETKRNNLNLLENYEKRGRTNYHLDHMYSVWQGFKDKTPPEITGHFCNLKMIPFTENISKHVKCSLSLTDLNRLINNYNDKT